MSFIFAGQWGPDSITGSGGAPLPNDTITVYESDGVTLATLYTDRTMGETTPNPTTTDQYGNLSLFAVPGQYVMSASARTLNIVVPVDPADVGTGAGAVDSVTAADDTITVGGTDANPTVAVTAGTFDAAGAAAAVLASSLQKSNNLSDVVDAGTSRFNIAVPVLSAVAAAATSNVNIASPGASVDGYSFQTNDEVLLTGQSTGSQDGVWTWNGASSPLTRPNEFPHGGLVKRGRTVLVVNGTVNGDTSWGLFSTAAGITIDTDAQSWTKLGAGGSGTVTTVSVVSTNGLAGTVANATTTPAITLSTSVTGLLKGNGTAIAAATAGTDYIAPGTDLPLAGGTMSGPIAMGGTNKITGLANGTASGDAATIGQIAQPAGQNTQTISGSVAGTAVYKEIYLGTDLKLYMVHFTGWNDVGTTITYSNGFTYTPGSMANPDIPSTWNAAVAGKTSIALPTTAGVAMTGYVVIGPGI